MPRYLCRFYASTAAVLMATSALADLSADVVWQDWKTYASGFGYEITGTETRTGDTLTISGITMRSADPDLGTSTAASIDQIVMQEQGDGSVSVDLPAIIPVEMESASPMGGTTRISLDYRQSGSEMVASGTAEAINYAYSFDTMSVETTGFEMDGEVLPEEANAVDITVSSVVGTSQMMLDSLRRYTQNMQAESVSYQFKATDPDASSTSDISGQIQDIRFDGAGAVPVRDIDSSDMDAMLAAGFAADGTFAYAANAMTIAVASPEGPLEGSVITGASEIAVSMDTDGLTYDVAQDGLQVDMSTAQFPAPLNFGIARSNFNFAIPVRQSDEVEDFAFGFALEGFTMSDIIWGLFDPQAQIPRDPATIALDLSGKAKLLLDFLDPATVAGISPDDTPAQIEALDINKLNISVAGADLSGTGAFVFENSASPIPQPVGAIDLTLIGGNGLLDKLIATGLLPEGEATGVRMMMGLLAVPGSTPDTLNSKIEINDQGHVLANGQRIQ